MANACDNSGANLGKPNCDPRLGYIEYPFFSLAKEFTKEEMEDSDLLFEALQAAMNLPNSDPNKVYAFPKMNDPQDNTGDPQSVSLADGYEEFTDALPKYVMQTVVGKCVQAGMASLNGFPGFFYVIDNFRQFAAKKKSNGGGTGCGIGSLYTNKPKWGGRGAVNTATVRLTVANADEMMSLKILKVNFNPADLKGLVDVELVDREDENDSGSLNNVFKIGAVKVCDEVDLYTQYKTLLNDVSLWRAYKPDGTEIELDSVSTDDATKSWILTVDATEYGALATGSRFYIDLVAPADLAEGGVVGIEGKKIGFKKYA